MAKSFCFLSSREKCADLFLSGLLACYLSCVILLVFQLLARHLFNVQGFNINESAQP